MKQINVSVIDDHPIMHDIVFQILNFISIMKLFF